MRPSSSLPCTGTLGRGSGRHWQSLFGGSCVLLQMIMVFDLRIGGCGYFGRKSANSVFVVLLYVVDADSILRAMASEMYFYLWLFD